MPAIIRIVLARQDEWRRMGAERWPRPILYAAAMSLIPAAATLAMVRTSDVPLPDVAALVTYLGSLASVLALGTAFWLLARMFGSAVPWGAGLAVAVYGTTPIWLASVLLFSPVLVIATVLAAVHTLYLYYVGARLAFSIGESDAAMFVMLCIVLAIVAATLGGAGVGSLGLV